MVENIGSFLENESCGDSLKFPPTYSSLSAYNMPL